MKQTLLVGERGGALDLHLVGTILAPSLSRRVAKTEADKHKARFNEFGTDFSHTPHLHHGDP
jgi:hypothetical protein